MEIRDGVSSTQDKAKQNKTSLESNNATPTSVLYQTDRETDTKLRKKKPITCSKYCENY